MNQTRTAYIFKRNVDESWKQFFEGFEFSSAVKHPDREGVWYAWGNPQNATNPISSFVSTDDGLTFELDEEGRAQFRFLLAFDAEFLALAEEQEMDTTALCQTEGFQTFNHFEP